MDQQKNTAENGEHSSAKDGVQNSGNPVNRSQEIKAVLALAWPAVALNGLQMLNSLLDTFFIGGLSSSALTAHGGALNIIFLVFSLAMCISVGSTALVSRAYGANNPSEYRTANRQCIALAHWVGIGLGIFAAVIALFAAAHLVPDNDPEAAKLIQSFLLFWSISIPASTVIQALAGSMRGIGDTRSPMFISGLQIGLHMVLNMIFIFEKGHVHRFDIFGQNIAFKQIIGLNMGLPGAGLALSVSALVSMLIYIVYSKKTKLECGFVLEFPKKEWVHRIMRIALPSAFQAVIRVGSFTVFTIILKETAQASAALGALRIGIAIESVMFMPAFGFSIAASALVGQSLGMKDPQRAERLGWICGHFAAIVILLLSLPLFIYAHDIAGHLTHWNKPLMQDEAARYIRILIATEVLFGYAMVLIGAINGAGDAKKTLWITIWSLWGVRVPAALILALPFVALGPMHIGLAGLGATGCWIAMSLSQAVQGLMSIATFKRGAWKTFQV